MKKNGMKLAGIALLGLGMFLAAVPAIRAQNGAQPDKAQRQQWKKNHPRRAEVNKRLKNQNRRINQGVKSGKLTQQEAQQLRQNDKNIRQEERDMAAQNGGHITKAEQRALNQQENQNSRAIYGEKHEGQQAPGQSPAPSQAPTTVTPTPGQ